MEIISNTAIIAVNQDRLGQPATRIWKKPQEAGGDLQLWVGSLADGSVPRFSSYQSYSLLRLFHSRRSTVVALLNTTPEGSAIDLLLSDVFIDYVRTLHIPEGPM